MNKIKIIRKRTTKTRIANDNTRLDMIRFFGVKRRHAFLRSCRKNRDKKTFNSMVITRALQNTTRDFMYEQIMGPSILKKRYEKPKIVIHAGDFVPDLKCHRMV